MAGDTIEDKLREITRHIILHDNFEGIYIEQSHDMLGYEIECHCGKTWVVGLNDLTTDIDSPDLIEFIENLNKPAFFEKLCIIKEKGEIEKDKMEDLFEKTQSSTISYLEI